MLVEVARNGKIMNIPITLEPDPHVEFELVRDADASKTKQKLRDIWLKKFVPVVEEKG